MVSCEHSVSGHLYASLHIENLSNCCKHKNERANFTIYFLIFLGTFPTCHDFGPVTEESEIVPLVVGFSGGQIQLVDPIRKELSKLFNEEVS